MHILLILFITFYSFCSFSWDIKSFRNEISVPYTTNSKYVLLTGAALTTTVLLFEDQIVDPTQKETVEDRPLGDFSKYGDLAGQLVPNALYILGQYSMGTSARAIGMFKATAYSVSLTTLLKYSVREPRPNNPHERNSFPSGHSTSVFAFSGYVLGEHGWRWGIPALVLSGFSAYSRINDNRHYLHDVIAGSTIGLCYGLGMSELYKNSQTAFIPVPIYDHDHKGIAIVGEF